MKVYVVLEWRFDLETLDKDFSKIHSVIENIGGLKPCYEDKYVGNNIWLEYTIVDSEVK